MNFKEMLKEINLYYITHSDPTERGLLDSVREAIKGGAKIIQYREKNKGFNVMYNEAKKIKAIIDEARIGSQYPLFIINDNIKLCRLVNADGVHLGQGDDPIDQAKNYLSGKIIGISVQTVQQAIEAERKGAHYLGVGPIYKSTTKLDAEAPIGLNGLKEIRDKSSLPIAVIGGVRKTNIGDMVNNGADMLCAISETVNGDTRRNVDYFEREIERYKNEN